MMKKFLSITALLGLIVTSIFASTDSPTPVDQKKAKTVYVAQSPKTQKTALFSEQSVTINASVTDFSLLYLKDGYDGSYSALAYKVYGLPGISWLNVNAIGAFDTSTTKSVYTGAALGATLYQKNGYSAVIYGGVKGFDITDGFKYQGGKKAWVFGLGVSIPLGK